MKRTLLIVVAFVLCSTYAKAQDRNRIYEPRNELKANVTNLIAFSFADFSYERLLNEESGFGIAILFNVDQSDDDILDAYREFSLTPYYRQYFSSRYAKGFFVEGFGMLNQGNDRDFFFEDETPADGSYTDFALGVSIGGKFVTRRGFTVEFYGGLGRNLLDAEFSPELVGRGGVSLGYRF